MTWARTVGLRESADIEKFEVQPVRTGDPSGPIPLL